MKEKIEERFSSLIDEGNKLISQSLDNNGEVRFWMKDEKTPAAHSWLNSASNLIKLVCPSQSFFVSNLETIFSDPHFKGRSTPTHSVQKVLGLIESAYTEFKNGMLSNIEFIILSEAFDDFLDHAEALHKGGKKNESAILASVVYEDTIKKIAKKNNIDPSNTSLEPLITQLSNAHIFNPVAAKRIKGFSGLRNHALHAEWDQFDIRDVGEFIKSLKKLIEDYLV